MKLYCACLADGFLKPELVNLFFVGKEQPANDSNTCHDICLRVSEKRWLLEARCLIKDLLTPQLCRLQVSRDTCAGAP